MKHYIHSLWLVPLAALGAAAGELPFTATLHPSLRREENLVKFTVANDSSEVINGILITRDGNDGRKFVSVEPRSSIPGTVLAPPAGTTSTRGFMREVWWSDKNTVSSSTPPYPIWQTLYGKINPSHSLWGRIQTPDERHHVNTSAGIWQGATGHEYFVARLHTYITIPQTGYYCFSLSVDDCAYARLVRCSNGSEVELFREVWSHKKGEWHDAHSASYGTLLNAGEVVYFEALHIQGGGNDKMLFKWQYRAQGGSWGEYVTIPRSYLSLVRPADAHSEVPDINTTPISLTSSPDNTIRITGLSLAPGDSITFTAVLSELESKGYSCNGLLWNLKDNTMMKTTIQVFGQHGNTTTVTLDDTMDNQMNRDYVFQSVARPLRLEVKSVNENGDFNAKAARFRVTVTDPERPITVNGVTSNAVVEVFDNIGTTLTDVDVSHIFSRLRGGMEVVFEAVQESYFDADGNFVAHSSSTDYLNAIAERGVERFVATGLSVNGSPQTADATRYTFTIQEDTIIEFRTAQEFALDISSDFGRTSSRLKTSTGDPWAGPLSAGTSGSPTLDAGSRGTPVRHWIAANEQMVMSIDAMVEDTALLTEQLYVRYVPYTYLATGAARGDEPFNGYAVVYTNALAEPRQNSVRHQVEFRMDGYGSVCYLWKIQFGVYAQCPESGLGRVQRRSNGTWVDTDPLGSVYWFDQEEDIRVIAAAQRAGVNSKALSGWMLGDGYYFPSEGTLNTATGEAPGLSITLDANNNPVAEWLSDATVDTDSKTYRGMRIVNLLRPVSVTWSYGRQVFYDPQLKLGEYMFQGRYGLVDRYPEVMERIFEEPSTIDPPNSAIWDANARVLFPVQPGLIKAAYTNAAADDGFMVYITASWPSAPHYKHIAESPAVQLSPDPSGSFLFVETAYYEEGKVAPAIANNSEFTATGNGWSLLRFKEVKRVGRGEPKEYVALRTVRTQPWSVSADANKPAAMAIIGQPVADPLDLAGLGTGYLVYQAVTRYNPDIYDSSLLAGMRSPLLYDMDKLMALNPERILTDTSLLPGPIIPVNEYPGSLTEEQRIIVTWYDDPVMNDGLLWPYASRRYEVRWPKTPAEGLNRIVIASEWGSESLGSNGFDQVIAFADGNIAEARTFNPTRFADLKVYAQDNLLLPGYNPNEEHALLAPSLRYAAVSPRPTAVYALRAGDLNNYGMKTSEPYVLVQFYDNVLQRHGMRVFNIVEQDTNPAIPGHRFANQAWCVTNPASANLPGMSPASAAQLQSEPHKVMEAGEPVIAFYPIGVVEGAVPCPESTGVNLKGQTTFWKDHKYTRWAVSGGTNAWFSVKAFYPLQPDFWWPSGLEKATLLNGKEVAPQVGASVAFLPPDLGLKKLEPKNILYKSDWPRVAPILKAGETLTYSGGEYRADHPTMVVPTADGSGVETIQTPGLPAVVAFAVGEVVFDALNPYADETKLMTDWTVRVAQVMETRSVSLPAHDYPDILQPANGMTRQYQGKYIFKDLPASLQNRVRYDPVTQQLELRGILNEKTTSDSTLTASPGAVYTLEPNILTAQDVEDLLDLAREETSWVGAVQALRTLSLNPSGLEDGAYTGDKYAVGLQPKVKRDKYGVAETEMTEGILTYKTEPTEAENARAFGSGLAAIPNGKFLDPKSDYPDVSWVTIVENNDPSMGGSPVTLHVIKVDRHERYRGSIKVVLSDNVFDENVVLRHTGDFGANGGELIYEWWYRPDDGSLNVPPPYVGDTTSAGDWKLFPDLSGQNGLARNEILLKGDPNAPETLLADSWWFVRYRHTNDVVSGTDWNVAQPDNSPKVNFEWAGAGNNDPFNDYNMDGLPDYLAQLCMGWIKRVLDAVNPYEARISDFTGDAPVTSSSMLQQLGPRYEGAVALNPDKDVVENVGLIELYQTVLNRASDLSINLSSPVSTPAIANALQLASTRLSDFYMLLGNEAYVDANDPAIGYGSTSVEYGAMAPVVHAFQNQVSSILEEELTLLRGQDAGMARPVYNRLFWNFTKGEGEAAYAMNYNISDINMDGFIDEDDAMVLYPQGHGDAWGHYLTALKQQYNLLTHPYFNWVSRSEFYNLMDIVMKVDFLDERKFAQVAAQKAKAGAEIVADTYREYYTEDKTAQWQGYTDVNADRAWGVQDWARRAGQGAYFDWITANALLPAKHPNETLEGIQKVDRQENADIRVVSANLNAIQTTLDDADSGFNPLGVSATAVPFDINPYSWEDGLFGRTHFEQVYDRAVAAINNARAAWDKANAAQNRLRAVANTEQEFRNDVYQQDISYRNELIEIFGRPYPGTVGSGKFYSDGYVGPDLVYYMYVAANSTSYANFPKPLTTAVEFDDEDELIGGTLFDILQKSSLLTDSLSINDQNILSSVSMLFGSIANTTDYSDMALNANDGLYDMNANDFAMANPLEDLEFELPVTASTYSLLAPDDWGERPAVGELQQVIADMLQLQIDISATMGSYEDMWIDLYRAIALAELQYQASENISERQKDWIVTKTVINAVLMGVKTAAEIAESIAEAFDDAEDTTVEAVPKNLPTGGTSVSPGDAAAPARAVIKGGFSAAKIVATAAGTIAKLAETANELAKEIAGDWVEYHNSEDERMAAAAELIAGLDDMLDDEGDMRAEIFAKSEQLRTLVESYRSTLSAGSLLMDEREAFNKRVAAMVQQNRYQDMAFRVERNHALQNYHKLLDIAARYTYLAAKAYDYETNLLDTDPGSPAMLFEEISKARTIGYIADGVPQAGDGLAGILAQLAGNYEVMKNRLGLTNPQVETGKLSLRSENFRVFPTGYANTSTATATGWSGEHDADDNWKQVLQNARVNDLWNVPEFRYLARPFNDSVNADGSPLAEPGIVLRFSTQIKSGNNVFGKPLAGGDHAYDPSVYATRIRSVGVWFSGYLAEDVLADLSATPRVYLIPTGADIMSVPNAASPNVTRTWNVLDQVIPVPFPGIESKLDAAGFVPLLDSLDGRIGQQRRFSSFRAYHDSGSEAVDIGELVTDSRLVGRSVWNTGWVLIIPGRALNTDPEEGVRRFIEQVGDIKLVFETYGFSGN